MRELVTLRLKDDAVECSLPGLQVSYKVFQYVKYFRDGNLVYDILEEYRKDVAKVNNEHFIVAAEFITLLVEKQETVTRVLEAFTKQTGKKPFTKDGVKTVEIATKSNLPF